MQDTEAAVPEGADSPPTWEPLLPEHRRPNHSVGWNILLGADLGLLALFLVSVVVVTIMGDLSAGDTAEAPSTSTLWLSVGLNFIMFAIVPVMWLLGTRVVPVQGALNYLRLRQPGRSVLLGVGLTGYPLAALMVLFGILSLVGGLPESGPNTYEGITWPLAVAISLGAGVGEEILFRGILLPWLGVTGQAILFGLAHITNGVLGFTFTLAFGLWAGWLVKRGYSLWALMTAHALYDMILLSWTLLAGA